MANTDEDALNSSDSPQQSDGSQPEVVSIPLYSGSSLSETRSIIAQRGLQLFGDTSFETMRYVVGRLRGELGLEDVEIEDSSSNHFLEKEIDAILDELSSADQRISENQLETDRLRIETREILATLKSRSN